MQTEQEEQEEERNARMHAREQQRVCTLLGMMNAGAWSHRSYMRVV